MAVGVVVEKAYCPIVVVGLLVLLVVDMVVGIEVDICDPIALQDPLMVGRKPLVALQELVFVDPLAMTEIEGEHLHKDHFDIGFDYLAMLKSSQMLGFCFMVESDFYLPPYI